MPETQKEDDVQIMTNTGTAPSRTRAATFLAPAGTLRPDLSGYRGSRAVAPTHVHTSITDPGHRTAIPL